MSSPSGRTAVGVRVEAWLAIAAAFPSVPPLLGISCCLPPFSRSRIHSHRVLRIDVVNPHRERRADTRERKHHYRYQRAVTQPGRRRHIDTVEQLPR